MRVLGTSNLYWESYSGHFPQEVKTSPLGGVARFCINILPFALVTFPTIAIYIWIIKVDSVSFIFIFNFYKRLQILNHCRECSVNRKRGKEEEHLTCCQQGDNSWIIIIFYQLYFWQTLFLIIGSTWIAFSQMSIYVFLPLISQDINGGARYAGKVRC